MEFDASSISLLAIAGLALGLFGGALGVGSGLMGLPFLNIMGCHLPLARLICIINNVVISASAVRKHKSKKRSFEGAGLLVAGSLPGLFLGYKVLDFEARRLWMIYCVFAVVVLLLFLSRKKEADGGDRIKTLKFFITGGMAGFFSMTLGIGGGGVMVPLLNRWAGFSLKRSIVISSTAIIVSSSLALVAHLYLDGPENSLNALKISAIMLPGMIIGGYLGGELGQRLPNLLIKALFCIIILIGLTKGIGNIFDEQETEQRHNQSP